MPNDTHKLCSHPDHTGDRTLCVTNFRHDKSRRDGWYPYCKVCHAKVNAQYVSNNKALIAKKAKEWRATNKDKTKEISQRYNDKESSKVKRRQYERNNYHKRKDYVTQTKDKWVEYFKNWHLKNYNQNKSVILDRCKQYRAINKELTLLYAKEWRQSNQHRCNSTAAKRRFTIRNATPIWVLCEYEEIINMYKLSKQKTVDTGIPHEVDHIIPLINDRVCGLYCLANLQILSAADNRSKSNKFDIS